MSIISWLRKGNRMSNLGGPRRARKSQSRQRPMAGYRPRLEALEDRCLLSGGVLDPTFGSGGLVTTTVASDSRAYAVATYPNLGTVNDGKIVAVGDCYTTTGKTSSLDIAVVRYNLDGTLDRSFGGTGEVLSDLGRSLAVQIQPDGKVLAAGVSGTHFVVVRFKSNGAPDASFGSNGEVITAIGRNSSDIGEAMVLQPDGKIVVAGETKPNNTSYQDLALVRYNANGTLDTSFGSGGKVTMRFASPIQSSIDPRCVNLALDPNTSPLDPNSGKLVVVAQLQSPAGAVVVRYNTNGTLDTTFGTNHAGYVNLDNPTYPSVAVQSDDRIVVSGTVNNLQTGDDVGLDRLNPDGTLDTSFGTGGVVVTSTPADEFAMAVTVQADGKIVVGGSQTSDGTLGSNALMAARYNSNGSLDESFGVNGFAAAAPGTSSSGYAAKAEGLALEPDGRIIVAGASYAVTSPSTGNNSFSLARFLGAGPQIGSFTVNANPVTAGSSLTLTAADVVALNPGSSVTRVAFYKDGNGDGVLEPGTDILLGYGTQAIAGTWTLTFSTTGLSAGTYSFFVVVEDSLGVFSDPFAITVAVI
jgi:uncharacterized delta-60 repeat protein